MINIKKIDSLIYCILYYIIIKSITMDPLPAINGNIQVVKDIIESGTAINKPYGDHSTTLLHYASVDNLDMVKYLVEHGADINIHTLYNWSPLMCALSNSYFYPDRQFEIIKYLIDHGAIVNYVINSGYNDKTPLHKAAGGGDIRIVKYLLDHGADTKKLNCMGQTAAEYARHCANFEMADLIDQYGEVPVKGVHE